MLRKLVALFAILDGLALALAVGKAVGLVDISWMVVVMPVCLPILFVVVAIVSLWTIAFIIGLTKGDK